MKYVTPMLEKAVVETKDVIAASKSITVVERNNEGSFGADYKIDFSSLFGTK